jgi:hypothetical protein
MANYLSTNNHVKYRTTDASKRRTAEVSAYLMQTNFARVLITYISIK